MFFVGIFGFDHKMEQLRGGISGFCPRCRSEQYFTLLVGYDYFHFFFLPLIQRDRRRSAVLFCSRRTASAPKRLLSFRTVSPLRPPQPPGQRLLQSMRPAPALTEKEVFLAFDRLLSQAPVAAMIGFFSVGGPKHPAIAGIMAGCFSLERIFTICFLCRRES